jgi:hypothetical protein
MKKTKKPLKKYQSIIDTGEVNKATQSADSTIAKDILNIIKPGIPNPKKSLTAEQMNAIAKSMLEKFKFSGSNAPDGKYGDNTIRKKGGSTKAKKFAALAPPYNKVTAADRIAGAKKSKSSKKK